ncbi:hypothetical protein N7450_001219 [Penicillium hetheringtonii]|uniref:Vacuolar sorting protein Vps3844 C-terminal domain-containing protein n=1 Tax=Penicillium hetheringtonii TaxID=911720 RepID=A0AAD6H047_9EURO|nr:hypothetical protein N7450_001219 [Penicillium hetheringtonii]
MHWFSKLLALAATSAVGTNAFETSIFTFHAGDQISDKSVAERETVSEDMARLILELRMRSPSHSKLGSMEPNVVGHLNQYADSQYALFGGTDSQELAGRNIIFLEGLDSKVASTLRKAQYDSIFVPQTSSELVSEALEPLNMKRGKHCTYNKDGGENTRPLRECLANNPVLSNDNGILSQDLLDLVDSMDTSVSQDSKLTTSRFVFEKQFSQNPKVTKSLDLIFADLVKKAQSTNTEITVMTFPTIENIETSSRVQRRTVQVRSDASEDLSRSESGFLHSNLAPVCHSSNSSCAEATNNCSGHGSCYLKYNSGKKDDSASDCYACRCKSTTVKNSDGTTKKIQWGGVACQKEDISSPFFLIAGVTVFAIILVGSAIGMLFSMGSEELPSVIGAGVGTSKTQT